MWGMSRTQVANLIDGVTNGFEKSLEIIGVGYRAQLQGKTLQLQLGLSHDVKYPVPDGIEIKCPSQTEIVVSGIDKQTGRTGRRRDPSVPSAGAVQGQGHQICGRVRLPQRRQEEVAEPADERIQEEFRQTREPRQAGIAQGVAGTAAPVRVPVLKAHLCAGH